MRAALVALVTVLGTASAAADGIYVSEAVGGTTIKNDLGQKMGDGLRIRFALGYRLNKSWAIEGFLAGDISTTSYIAEPVAAARCDCATPTPEPHGVYGSSVTTVGVDVKYLRPLSDNFEVYLRGSLGKGYLDASDYSGRGFGVGAGAQVKGKVRALGFLFWPLFFVPYGPKVTAALFVDTGADFYRLHRHGELDNPDAIDGSFNRLTIGWAVGADF